MYKKCIICELDYPNTNEYFHVRSFSSDGLRSDCKKCRKEKKLKGFKIRLVKKCSKCNIEKPNTKEFFYISSKGYRQRTRSLCNDCHKIYYNIHHIKKKYGLNKEDYQQMIISQNNLCKICNTESKRLVVDHDHNTGKVRDLLCDACNHALGQFKDNPDLIIKAANYIINHNKETDI